MQWYGSSYMCVNDLVLVSCSLINFVHICSHMAKVGVASSDRWYSLKIASDSDAVKNLANVSFSIVFWL